MQKLKGLWIPAEILLNEDLFPSGKIFRIIFDNVTNKFRILAKSHNDLDKIVESFSTINSSSFFSKQYGFSTENKNYSIIIRYVI